MTEIDATSGARRIPRMWFDLYLRTGATPWEIEQDVEVKFNPWHDSANGQFTFRGQGTWMGGGFTDGGGGSFGGRGASGNWGPPATAKEGKSSQRKPSSTFPSTAAQAVAAVSAASEQSHVVVCNGYSYTLDSADRTTVVTGTLTQASDRQRSRSAQAGAGGSDRLATDDGGHYIAARFNGPTDTFNHFAQDANFNRGGYRVLEDKWAKDIKAGKQVYVAITPTYDGSSKRPREITVVYSVNDSREARSFLNSSKDKSHGK